MGIEPGTQLRFQAEADGSLRAWPKRRGAAPLYGLLHDAARKPVSIDEMNAAVAEQVAARDARASRPAPRRVRRP